MQNVHDPFNSNVSKKGFENRFQNISLIYHLPRYLTSRPRLELIK